MNISVIGCGLIGRERILSVLALSKLTKDVKLGRVYDPVANLDDLGSDIRRANSIDEVFASKPELVVVSTPHDVAPEIIYRCFKEEVDIFVEKPLGRSLKECSELVSTRPQSSTLHVGFNYRFFRGVGALLADVRSGVFGELVSVNMVLGHGNAPGMEKSWKLDPERCGGGALIDPGVHLLDLALQIGNGNFTVCGARNWGGFWNTGIEEECHVLCYDSGGVVFNLQISLNRWRSCFRVEVNGTDGYGVVEGRGRSYGPQTYRRGKRWAWMGSSKSQAESEEWVIQNYGGGDSFFLETARLVGISPPASELIDPSIGTSVATAADAVRVMTLLEKIKGFLI